MCTGVVCVNITLYIIVVYSMLLSSTMYSVMYVLMDLSVLCNDCNGVSTLRIALLLFYAQHGPSDSSE